MSPERTAEIAQQRDHVELRIGIGPVHGHRFAQVLDRLLGAEHNLIVRHPNCGHDFPKPMREEAYATLDSVLRTQDRGVEDN